MPEKKKEAATDDKLSPQDRAALDAVRTKVWGTDKPSINFVKLENGKPVVLCFHNIGDKDEEGSFKNVWNEEITGEDGNTYNVAVFRVLDMNTADQQEKTLSVSSKKLYNTIDKMLAHGFETLEITKHEGENKFLTTYDVIPAGNAKQ